MKPSISIDKKFSVVRIDGLVLYFSYATLIAFERERVVYVSENRWSMTTSKHLNKIDGGDKKSRLSGERFDRLVESLSIDSFFS